MDNGRVQWQRADLYGCPNCKRRSRGGLCRCGYNVRPETVHYYGEHPAASMPSDVYFWSLRTKINAVYRYLFFTRTCAFQVLYMLLVVLFHGIAVHDGLHVLLMAEPHGSHLNCMFALLFTNLMVYIVCCHSDPGELAAEGAAARLMQHSLDAHPFDGTLYLPGVVCSTCNIVKPARSKHCRVYNRCVYKFDHYCVWIGNCVGGLNRRYFLALLLSLNAMTIHGVWGICKVFSAIVTVYHINTTSGTYHLIEVFFTYYPRLVILLIALVNLVIITCGFTVYHLMLAATNQTLNERYKRYYLSKSQQNATPAATLINYYDRGILLNLLEEFFPLRRARFLHKQKTT